MGCGTRSKEKLCALPELVSDSLWLSIPAAKNSRSRTRHNGSSSATPSPSTVELDTLAPRRRAHNSTDTPPPRLFWWAGRRRTVPSWWRPSRAESGPPALEGPCPVVDRGDESSRCSASARSAPGAGGGALLHAATGSALARMRLLSEGWRRQGRPEYAGRVLASARRRQPSLSRRIRASTSVAARTGARRRAPGTS